jgi:hypothetical protein
MGLLRGFIILSSIAWLVGQTMVSEGQRNLVRRDWGLPDNVTACRILDVIMEENRLYVQSNREGVIGVLMDKETLIYIQSRATFDQVKVGDKVYVWGTPAVIIAATIEGQDPDLEENLADAIRQGAPEPVQAQSADAPGPEARPVNVGVVGEVVTLDPFVIELADGKRTQILGADSGRITRISSGKILDLKRDSSIVAIGPVEDGKVQARLVFQGDTGPITRALRDFVDQRRLLEVPRIRAGGGGGGGNRGGGGGGGGR